MIRPLDLAPESQLDFWLGHWDVRWGEDKQGTNQVERILDGKVIQENFDGNPGVPFKGKSVSVYHHASGQWKQTWVDSEGNYWDFRGGPDGDTFILTTEDLHEGQPIYLRMVFYNIAQNELDWVWESSKDRQTWERRWHLHYTRHA